jgi:hypothetical protein
MSFNRAEQGSNDFIAKLLTTLKNCWLGVEKMARLHEQSNMKSILWTSIVISVTGETACIFTAETIDVSLCISIQLTLLAGAFAVAKSLG